MNIGEISKPSVDRTQVDKKLKVEQADPVLKTQVISDLVKLSDESQKRYQQEHKKSKTGLDKDKLEVDPDNDDDSHPPAIDLRV
jgi:hypothetical protein